MQREEAFAQHDGKDDESEGEIASVGDFVDLDVMQHSDGGGEGDAAGDEEALGEFLTAGLAKHAHDKRQAGKPPTGGEHGEIRSGVGGLGGSREKQDTCEGFATGVAFGCEDDDDECKGRKKSHGHGIEGIRLKKAQPRVEKASVTSFGDFDRGEQKAAKGTTGGNNGGKTGIGRFEGPESAEEQKAESEADVGNGQESHGRRKIRICRHGTQRCQGGVRGRRQARR